MISSDWSSAKGRLRAQVCECPAAEKYHVGLPRLGRGPFDSFLSLQSCRDCSDTRLILVQQSQDLDKIRSNTHSSDLATSTRTLDDQGIRTVPLGVEGNDVVAALQRSNWVTLIELLQPNLDSIARHVNRSHKPHNLTLLLSLLLQLVHLRIKLRQLLQELVARLAGLKLLGDQTLHREAGRALHLQARKTRQDSKLARHIQSIEIVARIRLGIPLILRGLDLGAELPAAAGSGLKAVEQEAHGAGEDALDLGDLVACLNEVLKRADHRQSRADGRLVEDVAPGAGAVRGGAEDVLEQLQVPAEGLLIRRHNAYALLQEAWVRVGNILVARVVDEDDLARGLDEVVLQLWQRERGFGVIVQLGFPVGERLVVGVVERFLGRREPDQREVVRRRGRLGEALGEACELVEEALSYAAGAWECQYGSSCTLEQG